MPGARMPGDGKLCVRHARCAVVLPRPPHREYGLRVSVNLLNADPAQARFEAAFIAQAGLPQSVRVGASPMASRFHAAVLARLATLLAVHKLLRIRAVQAVGYAALGQEGPALLQLPLQNRADRN